MKVLHVRTVTGRGGGPDKTIVNSPSFLLEHGHEALCAFLRPVGDDGFEEIAERARRASAPLAAIDDRGPVDPRSLARLGKLCREHEIDVWHGHDYKSNLLGLLLARRFNLRLVTTVHGWVERSPKLDLYYALDRRILRRYDSVICVSHDLEERCLRAGVPTDRLRMIPNAVIAAVGSSSRPQRTRVVIAAVGRLSPEKGFDSLIPIVAELRDSGRDVEVRIAGEGNERVELERRIAEAGLADHVRLMGYMADPSELYEDADLFVLPSLREGLPNVVLEAMAHGLPVVANDVGGVGSLVQHGATGLVVAPSDVRALHAALVELVDDAGQRSAYGEAGRAAVVAGWNFAERMRRVAEVYDSLGESPVV